MERRYPDPDAVPYPRTLPPRFPCQLTTETTSRVYPTHQHDAWMDKEGNGNTDLDAGHFHRIRGGKVHPDPTDGHTHELTMLPCGAGAPQTVARESAMVPQHYTFAGADAGVGPSMLPEGHKPSNAALIVGTLVAIGIVAAGVWLMQDE
jgi:hypothetical protein